MHVFSFIVSYRWMPAARNGRAGQLYAGLDNGTQGCCCEATAADAQVLLDRGERLASQA